MAVLWCGISRARHRPCVATSSGLRSVRPPLRHQLLSSVLSFSASFCASPCAADPAGRSSCSQRSRPSSPSSP
eukprot:scaffold7381_cov310-Pinguiococcus_pyrenoidosus.AAC.115